jgi:hypothetical protein
MFVITKWALSLTIATLLLASTSGCSNKGVEINKEASNAFDAKTDQPKVAGPGSDGGALNKGKKPAGK